MPINPNRCFMNAFGGLHTYEEMLQLIETGDYSHSEFLSLSTPELHRADFAAACGAEESTIYHQLKIEGAAQAFQFECYQCHAPAMWLAGDSRCKDCTRLSPEEVAGSYICSYP